MRTFRVCRQPDRERNAGPSGPGIRPEPLPFDIFLERTPARCSHGPYFRSGDAGSSRGAISPKHGASLVQDRSADVAALRHEGARTACGHARAAR